MRLRHRLTLGFVAVLAVVALIVLATPGGANQRSATHHKTTTTFASDDRTAEAFDKVAEAAQYATMYWTQVAQYATEYNREQVVAWVAAHTPRPAVHSSSTIHSFHSAPSSSGGSSGGGGGVGECTGFVIPDYIIRRESGGILHKWNTQGSGAFGCAQTLITHYSAGGTCAGDDPNTIEGQRDCVNRLSNGGRNLSPWSETR